MPIDPRAYQNFAGILGRVDIDQGIIERGLCHLSASEKKQLFSEVHSTRRIGEGHLYENCIYEAIIDLIEYNDDFKAILQKRNRITKTEPLKPGFMGFVYKNRDIRIGCDDMDHVEMDSVLLDSNGNFCIVEILNGVVNLEGLEREYLRRQMLLKRLTGGEAVPYVLISSEDIHLRGPVIKIMSNPYTYFVQIGFENYDYAGLKNGASYKKVNLPRRSKVMGPAAFPMQELGYSSLSSAAGAEVYAGLCRGRVDAARFHDCGFLNKLTLGRVPATSLTALLESLNYRFKCAEEVHSPSLLNYMNFDYAILAYELGDMRGSLYFKRKKENRFIKFGPRCRHTIEIERDITERAGGFYRILKGETRALDNHIITNYFESFYDNPAGERRNRPYRPSVKSLLARTG